MAQTNVRRARPRQRRHLLTLSGDYYDYNLLASVVLLTCFGLIMLYSTSAYDAQIEWGSDMYYFKRQAIYSLMGFVVIFIASIVDYHFYSRYAGYFYVFSNFLLFITKFIGHEVNGAKRWIKIGPIQFQSAEPAKLAIILFISVLILKLGRQMKGLKAPLIIATFGAITFFLTWQFTENMSTALIIMGITCILIFVAHPKTRPFLILGCGGLAGAIIGLRILVSNIGTSDSFRLNRILVWLDPEKYSDNGGYQVLQGLYAIGSGGLFGKGLGNSTQKIQSIPEAQNDMIFSIICEELGLFGAVLLTVLFVFLLYRLVFIAQHAPDLLGSLIVTGIFAHISLQVVLNIAVVLNFIPTTGVTLPFISYGGTSILFLMAEMGIALNVSRQIRMK